MKYWLNLLLVFLSVSLFAQEPKPAKIIIGGDSDYPPYEYINAAGLPDGYNVELSRIVAKMMGVEPEFRLGKWALVRSWLADGTIDLIQGMAFSATRAQEYYFSGAHTVTWRAIFTRKDSAILNEVDILNSSVVIQQEDVAEEYLRQLEFRGELNMVPSAEIALRLLENGDFDACVINYMLGMHIIQNQKLNNIKALPHRIQQREYCFASLDEGLIKKVDTALMELDSQGELEKLHNKWFTQLDPEFKTSRHIILGAAYAGIPLLILLFILVLMHIKRKKQLDNMRAKSAETEAELNRSIMEFRAWQDSFNKGPVILYKATHHPMKVHFISENIRQWGYTPQEFYAEGGDFMLSTFIDDRERLIAESDTLQAGEDSFMYHRAITKNGELRWVLDYYLCMKDPEGGEKCFYGYLIDITDQKKIEFQLLEDHEKAKAANTAKSHFLANMSHEIRTPLNGITGFLQVLMQMDADPKQMEIYDIMYSSSRNLLKIINDILDFSKIESGKMGLILSDFNPRYLINDLIKQFENQIFKENLIIKAHIQKDIPDVLKGDQLRLRQILINLLQNALKFTEHGQILLSAELYTRSETDISILFKVSDTGIGIDPKMQNEIFDNYSQGETYLNSKYQGTGLGLAIVKRLVKLMHGFIWVESEPDKGSCFFFILPFSTYNELPEQAAEPEHTKFPVRKLIDGRILLVEDEPVNQMVTQRQLETWGLSVDIAGNGSEALIMHGKKPYDLILMDIQMPVMDGIAATQKIRDLEAHKNRHTPIVAYTAAALLGDQERFLAAGMDEYLAKPVNVNEVYGIISKLIKKSTGKQKT
jgi:CheY-like chemotaxis protein/nitrogen-specific signal transduction histidine kinase/ABC-type amino acid transport substrate-binding protein